MGGLGGDGTREYLDPARKNQFDGAGADDLGGKRDDHLTRANGTDQWIAGKFAGLNSRLSTALELIKGERNGTNSGKNSKDGEKNGKN